MSKLDGELYKSYSYDWQTPPELLEIILQYEGVDRFDLDPCCKDENVPARVYYKYPDIDGLKQEWVDAHDGESLVFVNPPYGKALRLFMEKSRIEAEKGASIYLLAPVRLESIYQHREGLSKAQIVTFIEGKIRFYKDGEEQGRAPFGVMLLYYSPYSSTRRELKLWRKYIKGTCLQGTVMKRI